MTENETTQTEPFEDYESLTVDDVVSKFASVDDETVEKVKAYEATREKPRKGILEWERPPAPVAEDEPTFTRERLLGPEGAAIIGQPAHVLAGALHDEDDTAEFTRAQIEQKVNAFHSRPVETQEG